MKEASGHPHCPESEAQMSEAREWYAKTFGEAADADSLPIPEAGLESSGVVSKSYALSVSNDKVHSIAQRFGVPESVAMQGRCCWQRIRQRRKPPTAQRVAGKPVMPRTRRFVSCRYMPIGAVSRPLCRCANSWRAWTNNCSRRAGICIMRIRTPCKI